MARMHRFVSSHVPSIGHKTTRNVVFDQVESFVQVVTQVDEHRLCAHVTFKQVQGDYAEIFSKLKITPFSCQLFLDRLKSQSRFPYRLCFVVPRTTSIVKKLSEVKRFSNSDKAKQIDFVFDGFSVKTDFLHFHDYNFILKYLRMYFQSTLPVNPYGSRGQSPQPIQRKLSGLSMSSLGKANSIPRGKLQFYDMPTEQWKVGDIKAFFNHQWIQDGKKCVGLGVFLSKDKDQKMKELDKFFRVKGRKVQDLLDIIKCFDRDPTIDKGELKTLLDDSLLRNRLREILNQLNLMKNFASNEYLQVLAKKMSTKREEITLLEIERDLLYKERHLWDAEECRDELLMMILFNKELESFVQEKEEEFEEFKKKELSLMLRRGRHRDLSESSEYISTSDEILDIYHNEEPSEIEETSPEEFDKMLEDFSNIQKFHIDNISFKFSLLALQNDILREEKKLEREFVRLKRVELRRLRLEIKKLEKRNEELQETQILKTDELLLLMDDPNCDGEELTKLESELEILQGKIDLIEDKISQKEKETNDIKLKMDDLKEEMQKKKKSRIAAMEGFMRDELRRKFYFSSRRRKEVQQLIRQKIKSLGRRGNFELKVKLVLSHFTQARAADWQRIAMSIIDPIIAPKYYQFGFLHASVLIKNIGFHWFKNALVFTKEINLSDSYDDIVCIDADCPMICDETSLVSRITNLAEEIVYWNSYMKYAPYQSFFGNNKMEKNCQEFSLAVLDKLEYTDFYPFVKKYFDDLKNHVAQHQNDDTKMREVRFFKIDYEFYKKFEKAIFSTGIQCVSFHPKKKFPSQFVFERHYELDMFVTKCKQIDRDFFFNYPQKVQLLKGYDRAFWMKLRKTSSDAKSAPHDKGCPFLRMHEKRDQVGVNPMFQNRSFNY